MPKEFEKDCHLVRYKSDSGWLEVRDDGEGVSVHYKSWDDMTYHNSTYIMKDERVQKEQFESAVGHIQRISGVDSVEITRIIMEFIQ